MPGFAPAPAVTVARGGPSRSVESARGVAVQRLRRNKGFTAETITVLIKTAAMLWLNLWKKEKSCCGFVRVSLATQNFPFPPPLGSGTQGAG